MIPYGKQEITESDIEEVIQALKSPFITQGPKITEFEDAVKNYVNVKFATAVNSATAALHIACLALGVGEGDVVWTSPNSFVASANCALYCGAKVDFVDISPKTYNMCADKLEEKLKSAKQKPKVVIPVHFAGQPCNMERIAKLAKEYGFKIIEDASHAIGGDYKGKKIGNCEYSDITVFSFHPVKIITTAEGGMALTNDAEIDAKLKTLRTHGIGGKNGWYYEQRDLGYNYRITDIQAALGVSQLKRIDKYIARRHEIAKKYDAELKNVVLPFQREDARSALHLYPIQVENRKAAYDALIKAGVGVNVHYIPIHTHPYYQNLGFKAGAFPNAESYYSKALSLPMYATLTEKEQDFVIKTVNAL